MIAQYYNENLKPKALEVLKDNKDGTVDLGKGKTLLVGACQVLKEPKIGCCTLGEEIPAQPKAVEVPAPKAETIVVTST